MRYPRLKNEKLNNIITVLNRLILNEVSSCTKANPNSKLGSKYRINFDLPLWIDVKFHEEADKFRKLYWIDQYKYPNASLFKYKRNPFISEIDAGTPISKISFNAIMLFVIQGLSKKIIANKQTESNLSAAISYRIRLLAAKVTRADLSGNISTDKMENIVNEKLELIQNREKVRRKIILATTIVENLIEFIKLSE